MTIERGQEWGSPSVVPGDAPLVATDPEAARFVQRAVLGDGVRAVVRLAAGDLWRTLGEPRPPAPGTAAWLLPVDALRVALDGGDEQLAVAHVVFRRSWFFGPVAAAMNAEYVGRYDVAPRGHPNDGRVDVVEVEAMPLRQRWSAWRRLPSGSHVPHPLVRERRLTEVELRYERPARVWIDGVSVGRASTVRIVVVPDAFVVAV